MSEQSTNKWRVVAPLGVAVVCGAVSGAAHAQSFITNDYAIPVLPDDPYVARSGGPLESVATLAVDGSVGAHYETNIFNAPSGAAVSDFVYTISPRAVVRINGGNVEGRIEAGVDYARYASHSENDQLDIFLRGNVDFAISENTTIMAQASVKRDEAGITYNASNPDLTPNETRTAILANAELGVETRGQNFNFRAAVGVDVENYLNIQATGDPFVQPDEDDFVSPPINNHLRDNVTVYANAEIGRNVGDEGEMFGGIEVAASTFSNGGDANPHRDSIIIEPYIGYSHESYDGAMVADARVGVAFQQFENDAYADLVIPTFDASVEWSPVGQNYSLYAATETDIGSTITPGVGSAVSQTFEVGARSMINDRIELSGGLDGEYRVSRASALYGGDVDHTVNIGVGVGMKYFVQDHLYVAANASYDTTFVDGGSNRNNAMFGVSLGADY